MVLSLMLGAISHVQSTKNKKSAISLWYFKNEVRDKYDYLSEYELNVSFLLVIDTYAQSTQNDKFVISLQ